MSEDKGFSMVEDYIRSLKWSDEASDTHKTLVAGNIRGFYAHMRATNTAAPGMGDFQDKAMAWDAVCVALNTHVPRWASDDNKTGLESAVAAIAALAAQPAPVEQPRPMETAPKDGTVVRLLVRFTENGFEDAGPEKAVWTIGQNGADHHPEDDEWLFAGWNWQQDCFTQGVGEPIGWLPMIDAPSQPAPVVGGFDAWWKSFSVSAESPDTLDDRTFAEAAWSAALLSARPGGEDPIGWVFQHDETGRTTFCPNDGVNNPDNFAANNPRFVLTGPAYTHPAQAGGDSAAPLSSGAEKA